MSNNIRDTLVLQWNIYQHNHTFGLTGESSRNTCIESQVSASKQMQEHEPFSVLSDLPKTQATTLMPPWNYQRNLVRTCASDKMTTIHSSKRIIFKFNTQNRFCLKTRDWVLYQGLWRLSTTLHWLQELHCQGRKTNSKHQLIKDTRSTWKT